MFKKFKTTEIYQKTKLALKLKHSWVNRVYILYKIKSVEWVHGYLNISLHFSITFLLDYKIIPRTNTKSFRPWNLKLLQKPDHISVAHSFHPTNNPLSPPPAHHFHQFFSTPNVFLLALQSPQKKFANRRLSLVPTDKWTSTCVRVAWEAKQVLETLGSSF